MAPSTEHTQKFKGIPMGVVGPVDLGRLLREMDALDGALMQLKLTHQEPKMPKTSQLMDETIQLNQLDLLNEATRAEFKQFLLAIRQKAPVMHVSFSADPSPAFVLKLMAWLRNNIHPVVLLTVGIQPTIGAGCIVRTTNKHFDFSLARFFDDHRSLLMERLRAPAGAEAATAEASVVPGMPELAPAPEGVTA